MRSALRFVIPFVFVVLLMTALTAVAAANTVPSTRMGDRSITFQINHLRPAACSGLSLTSLVTGSGTINGTSGNDLILGSSGIDLIDGAGGDDCIMSGGGLDTCTGGAGTDVFVSCEVQIP